MNQADFLEVFKFARAIITGDHIVYTSGRHGSTYVNKDALYPDTKLVSMLSEHIALRFAHGPAIDTVIAPAVGGVILSQWVAHHLERLQRGKVFSVYAEKLDNKFVIGRGYDKLIVNRNVLVIEDILNTGGSAAKVIHAVRETGGHVVGLGALCNRGNVTPEGIGAPVMRVLINISCDSWEEAGCPLCRDLIPINTDVGHGRAFLERQKR